MVEQNFTFFAQAEARAEFAERSVQKLQKEVDRLEGNNIKCFFINIPVPDLSFET